jgi:O-antigen biosynthesis protein
MQNLDAEQGLSKRAVADKEQHIQNLEAALKDRERHIANLEAELAAARRQAAATAELQLRMKKIEDAYARLQEEQAALKAESKGLAERLASSNQHVHDANQHIREVVHELRASVERELTPIRNTIWREPSGVLSRLKSQELIMNQLLGSRTWRTAQALGRAASHVFPRRRVESQALAAADRKTDAPASPAILEQPFSGIQILDQPSSGIQDGRPPGDQSSAAEELDVTDGREASEARELYFVCDEPSSNDRRPRNRNLVVRGWALSEYPLEYVEVAIPGLAPQALPIATPRPDVKHNFPDLDKQGRCGFSGTIETQQLPNGKHTAHVRLIGDGKVLREIETGFLIDHTAGYATDYEEWIAEFEAPADEVLLLKLARIEDQPRISILMPVFNTEPGELSAAIESVIGQKYSNWELCITDDGSTRSEIRGILSEATDRCDKIKILYSDQQRGIAAALNAALTLASGEYIALLDHDDTLSPQALAYVAEAIHRHSKPELIYSDEDKLDELGERYQPFFKPEWSPDLILSTNYVCHLLAIRRDLMHKVGEFSTETDGSQDYDYVLRASQHAAEIVHIPHVLYHWRAGPNSTASSIESKPYTIEASRRALERFCQSTGNNARVEPGALAGCWRLRYPISERSEVSIIIASGGNAEILRTNLEGLFTRTDYKDFEAVVVDNSRAERIRDLVDEFAGGGHRIRYIDWRQQAFNYSRINNVAARQCGAPILLFLNDDVSAINSDWLTSMVELINRPEVGAVGAKLLFPNGSIQHAGVVMGLFENCGHAFYGMDAAFPHYFGFADMIRNVSAVTGACLMTKASVFWQAGGFDEERLAVAFNDVDLCLKIGVSGYRVLFTPFAQLYHHESFSKTEKDIIPHPTEVAVMQSKWRDVIANDPYYSPNLTRRKPDYSLPTLWS